MLTYPVAWVFGFTFTLLWLRNNAYEDMPLMASFFVNIAAYIVVGLLIGVVVLKANKARRGQPPSDT